MFYISRTEVFSEWFISLKDKIVKEKVRTCITKLQIGNFGGCQSIGDGVSEVKIQYGSGYRLYYTIRNREIIILLCGGDKSSQKRDILKAKKLAKEV